MPIIATEGSSKTFTPAPAGLHQAVCVDVVDLGLVKTTYDGETKTKLMVRVIWQIDDVNPEDGKRFTASKRYNNTLHEKGTLRKDLESWRARPFSADELKGFDLERLLGVNCQINVQHRTANGKTYANVVSIVPLGKGMTKLEPKDYVRVVDRAEHPERQPGEDDGEDVGF